MYGFVEKPLENSFDSVEIPTKCFIECYTKVNNNTEALMETKIETLKTLDIIDDNTSFLVGTDGVLNEEECLHMLQVKTKYFFEILQIKKLFYYFKNQRFIQCQKMSSTSLLKMIMSYLRTRNGTTTHWWTIKYIVYQSIGKYCWTSNNDFIL